MHETQTKAIHRAEWKRWLLYVDLAVFGIFILSVVVLTWDAFSAGFYSRAGADAAKTQAMWAMTRDVAIATGAFAWIFFRFFTLRSKEQREPWWE